MFYSNDSKPTGQNASAPTHPYVLLTSPSSQQARVRSVDSLVRHLTKLTYLDTDCRSCRLVATVGKTVHKKLNKKLIQDVDVPKACQTISNPTAPLALRLQGNLLYGVSRVFAQQCRYVLSDAEKTQSDMMTFFRVMQTCDTDPKAGKAKYVASKAFICMQKSPGINVPRRHQITLQDDPHFDPRSTLPNLDLFNGTADLKLLASQFSMQNTSQITPLTQGTNSSGRNHSLLGFDIPQSSHSAGSYRLPLDFNQNSPLPRRLQLQDQMDEFHPFGTHDYDPVIGINSGFDADGNIIELESELPLLPGSTDYKKQLETHGSQCNAIDQDQLGDNVIILGEEALPEAAPFPKRRAPGKDTSDSSSPSSESTESEVARAPAHRRKPRKTKPMVDQSLILSRAVIRNWEGNYLENMEANPKRNRITPVIKARENARALLFDNGIASIARTSLDVKHPLAGQFSGISLLARLQGNEPEEDSIPIRRGQRRVSAEAFDKDEEEGRRVRQRIDQGAEAGRGYGDDMGVTIFGDDTAPEIGMEAAAGLEDRHSSSVAPWSRPPSVIHGSSIRGHGSAQKWYPAPSPLAARGSGVASIERWSDLPGLAHGSDDSAHLHSHNSPVNNEGFGGEFILPAGKLTQSSTQGLDGSTLDFLGYATAQAQIKGYTRAHDHTERHWINFDMLTEELKDPNSKRRFVADAFMHILTLATKSALAVEQDGIQDFHPFGTIRIGLAVGEQGDDMADELA